jgi:F0F1-type ATP synthase assembly protein I
MTGGRTAPISLPRRIVAGVGWWYDHEGNRRPWWYGVIVLVGIFLGVVFGPALRRSAGLP